MISSFELWWASCAVIYFWMNEWCFGLDIWYHVRQTGALNCIRGQHCSSARLNRLVSNWRWKLTLGFQGGRSAVTGSVGMKIEHEQKWGHRCKQLGQAISTSKTQTGNVDTLNYSVNGMLHICCSLCECENVCIEKIDKSRISQATSWSSNCDGMPVIPT